MRSNAVFRGSDIEDWPQDALSALEQSHLLTEIGTAETTTCPGCEEACLEEVVFCKASGNTPAKAYVICSQGLGRIDIALESLRQWTVDLDAFAGWLADQLGARQPVEMLAKDRLWHLGSTEIDHKQTEAFLACGVNREDAEAVFGDMAQFRYCRSLVLSISYLPQSPFLKYVALVPVQAVLRLQEDALWLDLDEITRQLVQYEGNIPLGQNVFRKAGQWVLRFQGSEAKYFGDSDGMRYLHYLLEHQNSHTPSDTLYGIVHPPPLVGKNQSGEVDFSEMEGEGMGFTGSPSSDIKEDENLLVYRQALEELEIEEAQAERKGDPMILADVQERKQRFVQEMSSIFGRRGVPRAKLDPHKRQRQTVRKAIRSAIQGIEDELPILGKHLAEYVKTGTDCFYAPEAPIDWIT